MEALGEGTHACRVTRDCDGLCTNCSRTATFRTSGSTTDPGPSQGTCKDFITSRVTSAGNDVRTSGSTYPTLAANPVSKRAPFLLARRSTLRFRSPRIQTSGRLRLQKRKRIRDHLAHVRRREPQAAHDALDAAGEPALVQDHGRLDLHAPHGARALDAEPYSDATRDERVLVGPSARD